MLAIMQSINGVSLKSAGHSVFKRVILKMFLELI